VVIVVLGAGGIHVPPAQAAAPATCPERFPQVEWNVVLEGDVALYTASIPGALGERFSRETGIVSLWINEDIGPFETVVCLVGDDEAFPEPISSVVAQWYRARILERLDAYHAQVMLENFFDTDAVIDWTVESQDVVTDWIP
jgi:hypothetical protein